MSTMLTGDHDAGTRWRKASEPIWFGATTGDYTCESTARNSFNTSVTMLLRRVPTITTDWREGEAAMKAGFFGPKTDLGRVVLYRSLRLGHAVAFPGAPFLSSAEAKYLSGLGHEVPHVPDARGSAREVGESLLVDFAYAFPGRVGNVGTRLRTTASLRVERARADEWPVAATLAAADGLRLPFREADGTWLRPLVAPDGASFVDERTFASACAGSCPWTDHPAQVRVDQFRRMKDPVSVIEATQDWDGSGGGNARSARERAEEAVRTAGRLVSVEGIVHVACPEPALTVVYRDPPEGDRPAPGEPRPKPGAPRKGTCHVGWTSGDVDDRTRFGIVSRTDRSGLAFGNEHAPRWRADVPLDCPDLATDLAMAFAAVSDRRFLDAGHRLTATGDARRALAGMVGKAAEALVQGHDEEEGCQAAKLAEAFREGRTRDVDGLAGSDSWTVGALAKACVATLEGRYDRTPTEEEDDVASLVAP